MSKCQDCGTTKKVNTLCCEGVRRCEACWILHGQSGECKSQERSWQYQQEIAPILILYSIGAAVHRFVALDAWVQRWAGVL